jgi:outer membrane protein TolC
MQRLTTTTITRVLLLSTALGLGGCAIKPEALTADQTAAFVEDKLARVSTGQEAIQGPVSLYEAMARALKYNLDTKVEVAQTALKLKELDLSEYKLLPSLVANSGWTGRNNVSATVSENIRTGKESLDPSTSSDRDMLSGDLTLSWNVLDFGLSYVRAQQLADEVLIASEARRRIANRVTEDVRTAFWRAVTYQRLIARLRKLEARAEGARSNARKLYNDGLTPPMQALAYERELIEIRREIQKVEGDLVVAKAQLAALMNVEPTVNFTLQDSRGGLGSRLAKSPGELVRIALENRPEIQEIAYRLRINEKEATAALLELLPGAQLFLGGNFDSNSFVYNNAWLGYGAKVSWNLLKIVQYPERQRLVDAQEELLDKRALALTMAIMTQVHVARARYHHSQRELKTAADYLNVQNDILAQARAERAVDSAGEQALIREEMNALLAEVRFDLAHAQLQNAFASVYSAIGLDPVDQTVDLSMSVRDVAGDLQRLWRQRGDRVGLKASGLLRKPRAPKPVPNLAGMPPMPGMDQSYRSRTPGGSFMPPVQRKSSMIDGVPAYPTPRPMTPKYMTVQPEGAVTGSAPVAEPAPPMPPAAQPVNMGPR